MKSKIYADIIDVANAAGVSPATVSRTFNHPDKVKADTRRRIEKAVESTGYIRNRAAQAIHGVRSGTIGLIVPTLDNAIFSNLIQAFSDHLAENGFTMLVATHGYNLNREYQLLRTLLEHRVEGIGLIGLDHRDETYTLLERRETPAIAMWNSSPDARISCVGPDNYEAGRMISKHILDLGHTDIALLFPQTEGNDRAVERLRGVTDRLAEHNIEPHQMQSKYSIGHARRACATMLETHQPTAIIAGNDVIAQGVIYAVQSKGLKVPTDISVTGIGDFSGSADLLPSLTTVRLPSNQIGQQAAEVLTALVNKTREGPIRETIALELHSRESSTIAALPRK